MTALETSGWGDQPVDDQDLETHDAAWLEAKEQAEEDTKALRRARAQRHAREQLRAEDVADLEIPEGIRLDNFLARPLDPVTHRIDGLWPIGGRIILTAQFKAGKTTMRDEVIRSLVDHDPFLGQHHVEPIDGNVSLLDLELGDNTLQRWLNDHQIEHTNRVNIWSLQGRGRTLDLRDDRIRATWATRLQDTDTAVLVIDCLRPILDALGMSEHNEAGLFLEALDALMNDAHIGEALLLHHMGHVGERSRGDSRLRDWPMAEWRLVRDKDDENDGMDNPASSRYFTAYGRDVDQPQAELTYDPDTRRLTLRPGAPDRKSASKRRRLAGFSDAILRIVAAQPGIGKGALLRTVGGNAQDVQAAVDQLVEDGLIDRTVQGQSHHHHLSAKTVKQDQLTTDSHRFQPLPEKASEPLPGPLGSGNGYGDPETTTDSETRNSNGPQLNPDDLYGPPCPHCHGRAAHDTTCPNHPQTGDPDW